MDGIFHSDESRPAPGPLRLVQEFVNTRSAGSGRDAIADPGGLAAWLRGAGLLAGESPPSGRDVRRAGELREALRALLDANAGHDPDPAAVVRLNRLARELPVAVRFDERGTATVAPEAATVGGALGLLLGIVFAAQTDGSWSRLKACGDEGCRWAFYDASRNKTGAWCDMASCGNRHKVRAHRQRRRTGAAAHVHG